MEVTPEPKSRRPILVGALAALAAGL